MSHDDTAYMIEITSLPQLNALLGSAEACAELSLDEVRELAAELSTDVRDESGRCRLAIAADWFERVCRIKGQIASLVDIANHEGAVGSLSHEHPTSITLYGAPMLEAFRHVLDFATDFENDTALDPLYDDEELAYRLGQRRDIREEMNRKIDRIVGLALLNEQVRVR